VASGKLLITYVLQVFYKVELHAFEAVNGRAVRARREGEQGSPLFIVPLIKHDFPEPFDELVLGMETVRIDTVLLQFFEVEGALAANKPFQIVGSQNRVQHRLIDKAFEAFLEGDNLLLTLNLELVLDSESHELFSII